jgi:hypothetical protein
MNKYDLPNETLAVGLKEFMLAQGFKAITRGCALITDVPSEHMQSFKLAITIERDLTEDDINHFQTEFLARP